MATATTQAPKSNFKLTEMTAPQEVGPVLGHISIVKY